MIDLLLTQNSPYQTEADLLQNPAKGKKPKVKNEIEETMMDLPTLSDKGKLSLSSGLNFFSKGLNKVNSSNKYGGLDVLQSSLDYAQKGSSFGLLGMGAGAIFGAGKGMLEKDKFQNAEIEENRKSKRDASLSASLDLNKKNVENFYSNQSNSSKNAYGISDIDNFLNKNKS